MFLTKFYKEILHSFLLCIIILTVGLSHRETWGLYVNLFGIIVLTSSALFCFKDKYELWIIFILLIPLTVFLTIIYEVWFFQIVVLLLFIMLMKSGWSKYLLPALKITTLIFFISITHFMITSENYTLASFYPLLNSNQTGFYFSIMTCIFWYYKNYKIGILCLILFIFSYSLSSYLGILLGFLVWMISLFSQKLAIFTSKFTILVCIAFVILIKDYNLIGILEPELSLSGRIQLWKSWAVDPHCNPKLCGFPHNSWLMAYSYFNYWGVLVLACSLFYFIKMYRSILRNHFLFYIIFGLLITRSLSSDVIFGFHFEYMLIILLYYKIRNSTFDTSYYKSN